MYVARETTLWGRVVFTHSWPDLVVSRHCHIWVTLPTCPEFPDANLNLLHLISEESVSDLVYKLHVYITLFTFHIQSYHKLFILGLT